MGTGFDWDGAAGLGSGTGLTITLTIQNILQYGQIRGIRVVLVCEAEAKGPGHQEYKVIRLGPGKVSSALCNPVLCKSHNIQRGVRRIWSIKSYL